MSFGPRKAFRENPDRRRGRDRGHALSGAVAAVNLGASSGRVMLGHIGPDRLELSEVHRFANEPVALPDGLHWDVLRLYHEILEGLRRAARQDGEILSVGVDGWGVDYGLLDGDGQLLGNPWHYRDARNALGVERVHAILPQEKLYAATGIQFLPFNTVYQLAASLGSAELEAARTMLLLPDLFGYWLSGSISVETTNASTSNMYDPVSGGWATEVIAKLGLPARILPGLVRAGNSLGGLRPEVLSDTGLPVSAVLTAVGSHDTASAVVGIPAADDRCAYISCGTWGLVGVELPRPILTAESRKANFTNELGVDGRTCFLHNTIALWVLQESIATWERDGEKIDLPGLLAAAAELPRGVSFDIDDPVFMPPGDMPSRIADQCRAAGRPVPASRPAMARAILDSLAGAFRGAIDDAGRLSGADIRVIHIVGGGSRNELLCQLTADACGVPVTAGPVEATALGNALVQGRAAGLISGDLEALRAIIRQTQRIRRYEPRARASSVIRAREVHP